MGQAVDQCYNCRRPLREIDIEQGRAIRVGSLTACENCAGPLLDRLDPDQRRAIFRKLEGEPPPEEDAAVEVLPPESPPPERATSHRLRTPPRLPQATALHDRTPVPSSPPDDARRKQLWIVAGAVAAVALVFALSGGPEQPEAPAGGRPPTVPPAGRVEPPRGGAATARPADTRREEEEARRREALRSEIAALEKEVRALMESREYRKTVDRLEAERAKPGPDREEAIGRLAKEVRDATDAAFFRSKTRALEAQEAGNAAEVRKVRDEVAAWGIPKHAEDLEKALRDQVQQRLNEGLEAWWKLDETSGTTVADASGKGMNGTLRGGAAWQPGRGRIGGALRVDVGGSFAECGAVPLDNRSFTVCAWFKRAQAGRWDMFLGQGNEARNEGLHIGFRDNDKFTFAFFGNDLDSREAYTDTEWTHWAATYDIVSKARRIYRNGRYVLGGTSRDPYKGRGPLWIGRSANHDAEGLVDDVRIYGRALADTEIAALLEASAGPGAVAVRPTAPAPGGLVGWWKLDEGSGRTARDASGGGHDGTILGSAAWVSEARGPALAFRAWGDGVDTGFATDLPQWTVAVWARSDAAPGNSEPSGPVQRERNFQINWNHGDPFFRGTAALCIGDNTWYSAGFGPLEGKRWYHLAATYDGKTLVAYKDGAQTGTNTKPSGPPSPEPTTLKIGRHAISEHWFNGAVRDVRVYDRPLTADEMKSLFEGRLEPGR
jgi:hypothetical protein